MASSTVVHETTSQDKQLGTALPLQSATSQSAQTNHPRENERAGCKSPHPHLSEGQGEVFFLDILFHRMSEIAILRQLLFARDLHSFVNPLLMAFLLHRPWFLSKRLNYLLSSSSPGCQVLSNNVS